MAWCGAKIKRANMLLGLLFFFVNVKEKLKIISRIIFLPPWIVLRKQREITQCNWSGIIVRWAFQFQ